VWLNKKIEKRVKIKCYEWYGNVNVNNKWYEKILKFID
jgi:hypothetical protein